LEIKQLQVRYMLEVSFGLRVSDVLSMSANEVTFSPVLVSLCW